MKAMKTVSTLFALPVLLAVLCAASPVFADMQDEVDRTVTTLERFMTISETSIPPAVFRDAKGLAVLTVAKAGFIVSGRGGSGVVVARTGRGWSAPSSIGTGGVGFGFQIGAEVTEFVIVLNTREAVRAFSQGGNVTLGGDLSVAAGPMGRNAEANVTPMAAVYSYSRSQGLFAGASLEGTVIVTQKDHNTAYYGRPVSARDILSGKVKAPKGAAQLRKLLSRY